MIVSRFRRLATLVATSAVAFGLTGCSTSASDAATITYHDASGTHTIHITRAEFKKELGDLVGSTQFQSFLKTRGVTLAGDQKNTTGADFSTKWLEIQVQQSAYDAEFAVLELKVSADNRRDGESLARQFFGLDSEFTQDEQGAPRFAGPGVVFGSLPKSLQNRLIDQRARQVAVTDYYSTLTPAKEQALYDEFASTLCPSGRVVAQILVKDEATAKSIVGQLRAGASFVDLARSKSVDPSGKTGGAVGCLRNGVFVKEFENASYAAQFGVPTGPVKSQFGYHVILIKHPSFADLRAELNQALQQSPALVRDLRLQEMRVRLDPKFGTGGLAVDSRQQQLVYSIVPPAAPKVREHREKDPTTTTTTVAVGG